MFGVPLIVGWRGTVARRFANVICRPSPSRSRKISSSRDAWFVVCRHFVTRNPIENHRGSRGGHSKGDEKDDQRFQSGMINDEGVGNDLEGKFPERRTFSSEVFTVPNLITFARVVAAPYLGYLIYTDEREMLLVGLTLCAGSDWLDGYLARKWKQQSVLGAFIDPAADKVLICSLTIGLTLKGLIPVELATIIVLRDFLIILMGFVQRARVKREEEFFFDTTSSAFEVVPSHLSKINTGLQFILLMLTTSNFAFGVPYKLYIEPLWYITATTTIASGLGYIDGSGLKKIITTGKNGMKEKTVITTDKRGKSSNDQDNQEKIKKDTLSG